MYARGRDHRLLHPIVILQVTTMRIGDANYWRLEIRYHWNDFMSENTTSQAVQDERSIFFKYIRKCNLKEKSCEKANSDLRLSLKSEK